MSSRRAGLARPSAGSSRQSRPSTSTSNGTSARGSANGKGPRRSNGNATQDRFSSQRERDRLRRAADEDDDEEDEQDGGGTDGEDDDEADPEDTNAQDNDDDDEHANILYRVPKGVRLAVSEGVLTFVKGLGKQETERRVNELVRLALFSEFRRQPIRREDISKKVLDKSSARAFPHIFNRAQAILRSTFCYELAPIRAKGVENEQLAAQAREALKKQKSQQREREAASTQGKGKGKAKETHKAANEEEDDEEEEGGSRGPVKAWVLRSILPAIMTTAMAEPNAMIAAAFQGPNDADDEASTQDGMMINWDRSRNELGSMGLTFLILGFILLNGRTLPNDQLRSNLYRLGLSKDAPLPPALRPGRLPDDDSTPDTVAHPSTLRHYMALLVKQGYLEAASIKTGPTDGAADNNATRRGGRRKSRSNNNNAGDDDENAQEDNVEWKWGPRAEAEIGERGVAEWISQVYVCGGDDDEDGDEAEEQEQEQTRPARSAGSPTQASRSRRTPAFTQTQHLSETQRKRRHAESESLRKEIERAAGSQLVN